MNRAWCTSAACTCIAVVALDFQGLYTHNVGPNNGAHGPRLQFLSCAARSNASAELLVQIRVVRTAGLGHLPTPDCEHIWTLNRDTSPKAGIAVPYTPINHACEAPRW